METPKAKQLASKTVNKENDSPMAAAALLKDGHYFLQESQAERSRIEKMISSAVQKLESLEQSSDESGKVLVSIGKAKLLINKKFKQFEGLCDANIKEQTQGTSGEPFSTQNDDLAGFWDMVLIQVDQIHQMFEECDCGPKDLTNGYGNGDRPIRQRTACASAKKDAPKKIGSTKTFTSAKVKPSPTLSTPSARDEMCRKMIEERRKEMKTMKSAGDGMRGVSSEPIVQIFAP